MPFGDPSEYQYIEASSETPAPPAPLKPVVHPVVAPEALVVFEAQTHKAEQSAWERLDRIREELNALSLGSAKDAALAERAAELGTQLEQRLARTMEIGPSLEALSVTNRSMSEPLPPQVSPAEFAALERRVARLERCVFSPAQGADFNLGESVAKIEQKLSLLSEESVAAATRKARVLYEELSALQRMQKTEVGVGSARLDECFAVLERVDVAAQSLRVIARRLATLKDVHRGAALHATQLSGLETAVADMRIQADLDRKVLDALAASVKDNIARLNANTEWLKKNVPS